MDFDFERCQEIIKSFVEDACIVEITEGVYKVYDDVYSIYARTDDLASGLQRLSTLYRSPDAFWLTMTEETDKVFTALDQVDVFICNQCGHVFDYLDYTYEVYRCPLCACENGSGSIEIDTDSYTLSDDSNILYDEFDIITYDEMTFAECLSLGHKFYLDDFGLFYANIEIWPDEWKIFIFLDYDIAVPFEQFNKEHNDYMMVIAEEKGDDFLKLEVVIKCGEDTEDEIKEWCSLFNIDIDIRRAPIEEEMEGLLYEFKSFISGRYQNYLSQVWEKNKTAD